VDTISNRLISEKNCKELNRTYTAKQEGLIITVDTIPFDGTFVNAQKFASLLNTINQSKDIREKGQEAAKAYTLVDENAHQFMQRLKEEVIEKVRLSEYTEMEGKCDAKACQN
jgi:hypothetical protein